VEKKIECKLLKESILYRKLDNGLDVYVMNKPGYQKQFAIYAAHYGSNDSTFVPRGSKEAITVPDGIAHFLEHKLFEEEHGNVFESYSKLGAHPNAFTNFGTTAYYFTSTDNFYECLDILIGFVGRPYFTDENVEKEKGIIAQEIKMYEDNPQWRVFFNLLGGLYHEHPVKKDIAGTVESVYKINKELLYTCYETFYHPSNMVLFIAGEVDPEKVFKQLKQHFKDKKDIRKMQGEIKRVYPEEPKDIVEGKVEQKLHVSRPLFALGFKDDDVGYEGEKLLDKIIINQILLDMLAGPSSEVYNLLYEKGLIDATFGTEFTGEKDYGFAVFSGESPDPESVVNILLDEIEKRKKSPWKEEYFIRIMKKNMGQFIRSFNYLEATGVRFISMIFKGIQLFDYIERIEKIRYNNVIERLNSFYVPERSCLSLILPQ